MDLKKGDKVKFLNDLGGGIVIKLIDNNQAIVQIEDGFEIPCQVSELIKTESSGEIETKNTTQQSKPSPKVIQKPQVEKSVETVKETSPIREKDIVKPLFAIVPTSDKLDPDHAKFDVYLLNDGDNYFYYTLAFEKFERLKLIEKGDLEPEMKVKIGTFDLDKLLAIDAIIINMLVYNEAEFKHQKPIHNRVNLKTLNLLRSGNYKENDYFYEPSLILNLFENYNLQETDFKKIISQKEKIDKPPVAKVENKNDLIEEIDLHIESIVDDHSNMSNGEIINTQMARFTTALEGARIGKTKKIVFIHGIGNGKLRYELRKTLDNKYPDLQYNDASFAEYGFGATMVILKK